MSAVKTLQQKARAFFVQWPKFSRTLVLFFAFLLMSFWITRPLVFHIDDTIPFGSTMRERAPEELRPGDSTQLYYFLWLFKDNVENFRSPIHSEYEFGPLNPEKRHPLILWGFPLQIFYTLLALLLGGTLAFNVLTLLTFPLTALAQVWFARVLGASWRSAAVAGAIFAFALSRRVQMFSGHVNGHLYVHLPIMCAALWLTVRHRSIKWAVVFGVTLLSIALGEWHCFYYSSLFVAPLFFFALYVEHGFKGGLNVLLSRRGIAFCMVLTLFSASAVGYAFVLKKTVIENSSAKDNRGLKRVKRASVSPGYLVNVKTYREKDIWAGGYVEPSIYLGNFTLGAGVFALLLHGAFVIRRRRRASASQEEEEDENTKQSFSLEGNGKWLLIFFVFNAALFTLLALGIRKDLPGLYQFLFDHFPFWSLSRVPVRIIYVAHFCIGLSVAFAFDLMLSHAATKNETLRIALRSLFTIAVLLIGIDIVYRSPRLLLSTQFEAKGEVYKRIQAMSVDESGPLLFFPIYSADGSQNAAFQAVATKLKRPFLNGYAPTAPLAAKEFFNTIRPMNKGLMSHTAHCAIYKTGARYLVQDTKAIRFLRSAKAKRNALEMMVRSGQLSFEQKDEFAKLYKINPPKEGCP